MSVSERSELGYSEGSEAIVRVLGAECFSVPETEEHVALSEQLMSGWRSGEKVWDVEIVGYTIGAAHLVDFGLFPTRSGKLVRLSDKVGGWGVRIATPVNENVKYAWVVVGHHDESIVPTRQTRDSYGRPQVALQTVTDPTTGEVRTFETPVERPLWSQRTGKPFVIRKFAPVMWKRFDVADESDLEFVQSFAADLRDRMIEAWEAHTAPMDDGAEEERIAAAADRALSERDEPEELNVFEELA